MEQVGQIVLGWKWLTGKGLEGGWEDGGVDRSGGVRVVGREAIF
jgi:hypothetical protein